MRKTALLLLLAVSVIRTAHAGHWTLASSPIMINGNAMLADWGQTLTIDPGVQVIMTGPYQLTVRGKIRSMGTQEAPVVFKIQDTTGWSNDAITAGGWRGIRFDPNGGNPGDDLFQWTFISDMKGYGITASRKVTFNNCKISHSRANDVLQLNPGDSGIVMNRTEVFDNVCTGTNILWLMNGSAAKPSVISNCSFHHNRNGSAIHTTFATVDLLDNDISYNSTNGIGASAVNIEGTTVNILRNRIHHNSADAVAALHATMGKILIDGNLVTNNVQDGSYSCGHTDGGAGMHLAHNNNAPWDQTEYTVRNNIIANNYSNYLGAGIYVYSCKIWLSNNTIVNNRSKYMGAGVYTFGNPQLRIKNNIIWGNRSEYAADDTAVQIKISGGTYLSFNNNFMARPLYKDIVKQMAVPMVPYTGDTTKNYFAANPGFINPTLTTNTSENAQVSNFGITAASPCINRADSVAARLGAVDFLQNPRFNGKPDMGAIERTGPVGIGNAVVTGSDAALMAWPNPAKDNINLVLTDDNGTVTLYSMTGAAVLVKQISATATSIPLQGIAPGYYTIRWEGKGGTAAARILVD